MPVKVRLVIECLGRRAYSTCADHELDVPTDLLPADHDDPGVHGFVHEIPADRAALGHSRPFPFAKPACGGLQLNRTCARAVS